MALAVDLVVSTSETLKDFRSDERWEHMFDYIGDVAKVHNIDPQIREQRKRQPPKRLDNSVTLESTGYHEPLSTRRALKQTIYYPVLDHMLSEIDRRFSKVNLDHMKALQACTPNSSHFLDVSRLMPLASFYSLDTDLLANETSLAKRTLQDKTMESVMDVFTIILPMEAAFPTIKKLLQIALTLVVSTAQCERSFSALKRIKTYLRTTMSEERLANTAVISMEKDLADNVSFDDILTQFEGTDKNRTILLS